MPPAKVQRLPEALATLPGGLGAAVLEMGMSTPGEIRRLTELAPPDLGLITNIGQVHMENFPDGQEGIARAKGELVAGLRPGGAWMHLEEDPWCRWVAAQPCRAALRSGRRAPLSVPRVPAHRCQAPDRRHRRHPRRHRVGPVLVLQLLGEKGENH